MQKSNQIIAILQTPPTKSQPQSSVEQLLGLS